MKIIVLMPFEEAGRAKLQEAAPDAELRYFEDPDDCPPEEYRDAEAVIGNPPVTWIGSMRKLRWVQLRMAGTEPYARPGVLPEDVLLTNATGAFGHAISEHMLAATLMLVKKLHLYLSLIHI